MSNAPKTRSEEIREAISKKETWTMIDAAVFGAEAVNKWLPYLLEINADLLAALERHGAHNTDCPARHDSYCECGLDAAIALAKGGQ